MVYYSSNFHRKIGIYLKQNSEIILTTFFFCFIFSSLTYALWLSWAFTTDDAYISWHYAESLVNGHGLRWYPENNTIEGYSNFSWVMLAALVLKLGLPLISTIKWFSTLCLFFTLFCLYRLSRIFLSPLPAILPLYLFSHYEGVAWWTVSGLESSLYLTLVVLLTWQTFRAFEFSSSVNNSTKPIRLINFQAKNWLIACLTLTFLSLTRFEGILWGIILTGLIGCLYFSRSITLPQLYKILIIAVISFIIPYGLYFFWRLLYFGQFFPNSYLCKIRADYYRFYLVNDYLKLAFPCFILSLPFLLSRFECLNCLLWLPSLIYCALLWRADPIIAHYNRLFLAPFCLLSLMSVLGVWAFCNLFSWSKLQKFLTSTLIVIIFTYFFIPGTIANMTQLAVEHYHQRMDIRLKVANLLNHNTQPQAKVLLADCGIIPYIARNDIEFIDSQCLNNKKMTSKKINMSYLKYAAYLENVVKPDWIVRNYYPKTKSEDELTTVLENNGFFKHYELISTYQSHQIYWKNGKILPKMPDHVYMIYKCLPSFCKTYRLHL